MATCQTSSTISVYELCKSFSVTWKSSWLETLSSKFVSLDNFDKVIIAQPFFINVLSTLMPDISTLITNIYIYNIILSIIYIYIYIILYYLLYIYIYIYKDVTKSWEMTLLF